MPAVKCIERLDLKEKFPSPDGHWLMDQSTGERCRNIDRISEKHTLLIKNPARWDKERLTVR